MQFHPAAKTSNYGDDKLIEIVPYDEYFMTWMTNFNSLMQLDGFFHSLLFSMFRSGLVKSTININVELQDVPWLGHQITD